jgi:hypothetical protein
MEARHITNTKEVKSDYRKFLYLTESELYVTYTVPLKDHNTSVAYL